MSEILRAENVHKSYSSGEGKLHVLKGVSMGIEGRKVTGIAGPSGAGKSTLLHALGGIDRPDEGSVFLRGRDIYAMKQSELAKLRNKTIGFVFQFYHLLPELTAMENVMLPGLIAAQGKARLRERARELLDAVGLDRRGHHRPSELSGGEMQRVAIARALINEPDVVLCDEPTGNLDSRTGMVIVEQLMKLNRTRGHTFVIVTHDTRLVETVDTVLQIKDGVLLTPAESA